MLRSSFQFIRCKFRRMHIEDPLTPEIFSLSQMDELVRGVLLPLPIAQSLYSSFLARPRRVLGWSRLPVILCAGFPSFYRLWDPEQTIVCRFPLQSSNWSIIFSIILLTKELIFIYNYAYSSNYARGNRCHDSEWCPKLDNLDYFQNSSIRCSWTWWTHVIQSPTPLFPGFVVYRI